MVYLQSPPEMLICCKTPQPVTSQEGKVLTAGQTQSEAYFCAVSVWRMTFALLFIFILCTCVSLSVCVEVREQILEVGSRA